MEKINSISLTTIIVGLSGASYWGIISSYVLSTSKNATFISLIIGFILSLFITKIFLSLFNKRTDLTIIGKNKLVYGKFSYIINTLFIVITLGLYLFQTYRLTSFLSSQYLTETPKIFMHLLIIVTTFYIASKNIETVTRLSIISLLLALVIYLFDISSLIKYVKIDNLLPIFTVGNTSIIKSILSFALYFSVPTLYINSIKKDQIVDKNKFNKTFYFMLTLSFIMLFSATITTLGIYGSNLTSMFDYPLYTVLKRITLFSFVDSVENISIMLWILYVINSANMMLYTVINSTKETFKIKKNKYIIIPLFLVAILIPKYLFMPNNYVETFKYLLLPLSFGIILLIITIITLILIKKKV